jgi:release factor glutamine methyltransferase
MSPRLYENTVFSLLSEGRRFLEEKKVAAPSFCSLILLSHLLGVDGAKIYQELRKPLPLTLSKTYSSLLKKRAAGCPLAYLTGSQGFWTLELTVEKGVFIPRPETEHIIEEVLSLPEKDEFRLIADIGTGSGNIALALASELPRARVIAVDISQKALAVAEKNRDKNGLSDRVEFLADDLFSPLYQRRLYSRLDLIVSNPPYIPPDEVSSLPREVRDWEPKETYLAKDGVSFHRRLFSEGGRLLKKGGYLIVEMGYNQEGKVKDIINSFPFRLVNVRRDLNGIPRVISARFYG